MTCAVCNVGVIPDQCAAYSLCGVRGRLCATCAEGLQHAVAAWITGRMEDLAREREAVAKLARRAQEKSAAAVLAKEVSHTRLAALAAEQFPKATRTAMRKREVA